MENITSKIANAQVNQSTTEISREGADVLSAATTLSDLAHTLQTMIDRFTVR